MSNQDDELRRNQAAYNAPAPTGDATDLHEQAQQALYDRVDEAHAKIVQNATQQLEGETKDAAPDEKHRRKSILKERAEMLLTSMRDKAKAVYEDAARRRGWHQASLDQLQGAVGLPLDAAERQAEVERRLDAHHEAMAPIRGAPPQPHPMTAEAFLVSDKPLPNPAHQVERSIPRQEPTRYAGAGVGQAVDPGKPSALDNPFASSAFSSGTKVETPAERMQRLASAPEPK